MFQSVCTLSPKSLPLKKERLCQEMDAPLTRDATMEIHPKGCSPSSRSHIGCADIPLQKKPYSAVTVAIERLTAETYEEDDLSGIPDLVEVIKLQDTGPAEAARALRKKLKYGSVHRQLRALTLLDGLIQNAGPRFQRTFADETLLERLRVCGSSDLSDPDVKKKCRELFSNWAQYKNVSGMGGLSKLHKAGSPTQYHGQSH